MRYTQLGERGPMVSTIGFGAWAIGGVNWGATDDAVSLKAIHAALDAGVTLLDTADVYGWGHSEELIARVLRERGKGQVVVATKAGNDFYYSTSQDAKGYGPIRQNMDKDYIISAAEKSLQRLGLEAIDILQLHSPDLEKLQRDDPWEALYQLKKAGKILHAGWSVQSFQETAQAFLLDLHHDLLDCIQVRYNLLEREAEDELFPKAQKYGIGVIARIPLLFGFLTGKFSQESRFSEDDHRRMNLSPEKIESYLQKRDQAAPLYNQYPDQSQGQIALRFCLSHPACDTAIPGAKTQAQVQENCRASDLGPIPLRHLPPRK